MWSFRCERFPRGVAHIRTAGGTVVDFTDGRATVDSVELAAALLAVPPVFRIVQTGGPSVDGEVPDGSVADVLAWVGDDPDRAARALTAEQGRGDKARTTLVSKLTVVTE